MGAGSLTVSVGYIIYSFSDTFLTASIGFFVLAAFIAFANTGFMTFYQSNIPAEVMGRIGSGYGFIEAIMIIIATLIFGIVAQLISIKFIVIVGSVVMLMIALVLNVYILRPLKVKSSVGVKF